MMTVSVCHKLFEQLLLRLLEPVIDPQLPDKQAGIRHSRCITDQVFKLAYDVEHRFEESKKSRIVLADLTVEHDSLLYSTRAKRPITAFDLVLLLWTKF